MRRAAVLVLLVACASTQRAEPTPVKGQIAELDFIVGRWRAEAKNPQSGETFELLYRVEPALGGRWYVGTGSAAALDLEIHDLWGKDPVTGEIVRTIFDSQQTIGTVRSSGWQGDTLVLEGDAATTSGKVRVRETITRRSRDELHAVWEALSGESWSAYSIETLRREP